MATITFLPALVRARLGALGPVFTGPFNLNLFGWRAPTRVAGAWDDVIGVLYQDEAITWRVEIWTGTTDPGAFYLAHPLQQRGTAILVPGRYAACWEIGLHHGVQRTLVQRAPMRFWRDSNRDGNLDTGGPVETANIGCNLHHAAEDGASAEVGKWSAACQVIRDRPAHDALMRLVDQQALRWGSRFSYTLLTEE